jgi:hypothetical protein
MRRYREIKEVEGRLPFLRFSRKVKDRQKQNEYMSIQSRKELAQSIQRILYGIQTTTF